MVSYITLHRTCIRVGMCMLTAMCNAALPVVLAHCDMIRIEAMVMSIVGGLLIYGTIISFTLFFQGEEEF